MGGTPQTAPGGNVCAFSVIKNEWPPAALILMFGVQIWFLRMQPPHGLRNPRLPLSAGSAIFICGVQPLQGSGIPSSQLSGKIYIFVFGVLT